MTTINIAQQFSSSPAGRFHEDGPFNGALFRENFLVPALNDLKDGDDLIVILDGVSGFGSSFLEEAFGGLVRDHRFDSYFLKNRIRVVYSDPALAFYADSIADFLDDAGNAWLAN